MLHAVWCAFLVLPSGQEWVADGEEPLEGEGDGAVDAAHQSDLGHRDDDGQRGNADGLVVGGPELAQREQVDGTGHVDLEIKTWELL